MISFTSICLFSKTSFQDTQKKSTTFDWPPCISGSIRSDPEHYLFQAAVFAVEPSAWGSCKEWPDMTCLIALIICRPCQGVDTSVVGLRPGYIDTQKVSKELPRSWRTQNPRTRSILTRLLSVTCASTAIS